MTSLRLDVGKMILVLCDRIRYERVSQILWTAEATLQQSITPAYRSGTSSFHSPALIPLLAGKPVSNPTQDTWFFLTELV